MAFAPARALPALRSLGLAVKVTTDRGGRKNRWARPGMGVDGSGDALARGPEPGRALRSPPSAGCGRTGASRHRGEQCTRRRSEWKPNEDARTWPKEACLLNGNGNDYQFGTPSSVPSLREKRSRVFSSSSVAKRLCEERMTILLFLEVETDLQSGSATHQVPRLRSPGGTAQTRAAGFESVLSPT